MLFTRRSYELPSLDAWVDLTVKYYPSRSPEAIRSRLESSLKLTAAGGMAKMYDERFREPSFQGLRREGDRADLWAAAVSLHEAGVPILLVRGGKSPVITEVRTAPPPIRTRAPTHSASRHSAPHLYSALGAGPQ